jgi:iron complex outermembrane receptor protein
VTALPAEAIAALPVQGLSDLARLVPGASVRSYGGPAGVQTVSIRGLSPENTLVLVDGVRWNSPQNALADLALFRTAGLDRFEFARSGQSALYGADAVGGTMHLAGRAGDGRPGSEIEGSLGSPGTGGLDLYLAGGAPDAAWSVSAGTEYGRGDYRYRYDDGVRDTIMRRSGADYRITGGGLRLHLGDSSGNRAEMFAMLTGADRGSAPAVTSLDVLPGARLTDRQAMIGVSAAVPTGAEMELRMRGSWLWSRQEYRDPGIRLGSGILESSHRTTVLTISPELALPVGPATRVTAGVEVGRSGLRSSDVSRRERLQGSVYAGAAHLLGPLRLYPSLRLDTHSGAAPRLHPGIGVNAGVLTEPLLRVRAAVNGNSRLPTFNELFWEPGGNPDLRPERSLSAEGGLVFGADAGGRWEVQLTAYRVATSDRIVWLPGASGIWSPRNLRTVISRGVEAEVAWTSPGGVVRLSVNGTRAEARRTSEDFPGDPAAGGLLPYVPRGTLGGTAVAHAGPLLLSVTYAWTGERFADEVNARVLPAYGVADAALSFTLHAVAVSWTLKGEVFNLFDTSYSILPLYPMPMREFTLTIGVQK